MAALEHIFNTPNPIIGVVHLLPLPTSPLWRGDLDAVIVQAEREATALAAGGINGVIIENYNDMPFTKGQVDPAVVSAMSIVVKRIEQMVQLPLGLNVLRNDGHSALAIAACTGAKFIRVNVLSGVMVTDQGTIEGDAYNLLRYRRHLGVDVQIYADVLVKHARPLATATPISVVKDTVERGLADGIILSGWATGHPPAMDELEMARAAAPDTPIFIGSGADIDNIGSMLEVADGAIVATSLKRRGKFSEAVDPIKVSRFVQAAQRQLAIGRRVDESSSRVSSAAS
ncbi:MAG: photosystem I biogenesis protein BtpA [Synechococcus sp.]